jgi:hypothetical protein
VNLIVQLHDSRWRPDHPITCGDLHRTLNCDCSNSCRIANLRLRDHLSTTGIKTPLQNVTMMNRSGMRRQSAAAQPGR